jgi:hypothetical protein
VMVLTGQTALVICGMGSLAKIVCRWRVSCFDTTVGLLAPGTADTSGRMVAVGASVTVVLAALALSSFHPLIRLLNPDLREIQIFYIIYGLVVRSGVQVHEE